LKDVNKIEFVLENCEVITLPILENDFIRANFFGIKKSSSLQSTWYSENESCKYAEIIIPYECIQNLQISNFFGPKQNAWERLNYKDVTSICIVHDDPARKEERQIYVPFKGEFVNKLMKIKIVKKEYSNHAEIIFEGRNIFERLWSFINCKFYKLSIKLEQRQNRKILKGYRKKNNDVRITSKQRDGKKDS
jgi:hypothetical protein